MTNCGASSESCCTSLEVPGGTFYRTYSNNGGPPSGEADQATVSGFRLDKYDVTVGRFRRFVDAVLPDGGTGWLPAAGSGKHTYLNSGQGLILMWPGSGYEPGWSTTFDTYVAPTDANLACDPDYATWTSTPGSRENLPINCVTWYEAYAFCIWDGGFLPSEAEWENAAAGGTQQREYPWGSAAPATANQYAIYGCYYNPNDAGLCTGAANIAPVGTATLGAGRWGQLDLAGDEDQWNLDSWSSGQYYFACTDCVNIYTGDPPPGSRMIRGGLFDSPSSYLLPTYQDASDPSARSGAVGFRCARAP
ncbi:MAG: formylglycine-generating enzyme family protein [Gemmatimonadales bacterium]